MQEESITLTANDQQRALALTQVLAGEWTVAEAAASLGLSARQVQRLVRAFRTEGPAALVHGNRGRRPAHALAEETRTRVADLARGTYPGFNDHHLTDKLATAEHLPLSRSSVRRILRTAGIPSPRTRRPPAHRQRRERMPQTGMLLQADGSRHRWLGPAGPYLTLVGGIDDATGIVPAAVFREQEDAHGYMLWLRQVLQAYGIPQALYVDRHSIHERRSHDLQALPLPLDLPGHPPATQFGRVLQELGITLVTAHSPQAKGRVERLWGTLQDRLVRELQLAGAQSVADANRVLGHFLPEFNARFAVPAARPGSAYRPVPAGVALEEVVCFKYLRPVAADNTVQVGDHHLQLEPTRERASYARVHVEVQERLDGALVVMYQQQVLATRPAPPTAPQLRARKLPRPQPAVAPALAAPDDAPTPLGADAVVAVGELGTGLRPVPSSPTGPPKPAPDHPWNRRGTLRSRTKSQTQ